VSSGNGTETNQAEPTTAIAKAPQQQLGVRLDTLEEVQRFANVAIQAGIVAGKGDKATLIANAVIKVQYGAELGLPPMQSLVGVYVVHGKPALQATLVGSLIQRSGRFDFRQVQWTEKRCELEFFDRGQSKGTSSFSIEDAKKAGLIVKGGNWEKYPKAMVWARALTAGARAHCPSVFNGPVYTPEELQDGHVAVVSAAEVVRGPPADEMPQEAPTLPEEHLAIPGCVRMGPCIHERLDVYGKCNDCGMAVEGQQ
jgi:hypothetical protein